jgi:hypothetical protein
LKNQNIAKMKKQFNSNHIGQSHQTQIAGNYEEIRICLLKVLRELSKVNAILSNQHRQNHQAQIAGKYEEMRICLSKVLKELSKVNAILSHYNG